MRWSQLKLRVEQKFATSLRGRVELFQTVYRRASHDSGEVWIAIDGKRSFSWGEMSAFREEAKTYLKLRRAGLRALELNRAGRDSMQERGILFRWNINVLLLQSLSFTIEAALKHKSPLIRGLAVLDRRCGKRRLLMMIDNNEHPFVRVMLELRREAEGMKALTNGSGDRGSSLH